MQIISATALMSINETIIIQALSFLIFMLIMNKIMFKPLKKSIAERESYIEKIKKEMTESEKEIYDITINLKEKEQAMRRSVSQLNAKFMEDAYKESDNILKKAQQDIMVMKKEAYKEIYSKLDACRKDIETESKKIARLIIGNLLSGKLA
ncbi:MAG: hypothetical protein JRJ44_00675 [Deltaproteobacteria bacterium]|nr:hypothetical protein [Deltaproteobacteria bacterium]